VPDPFAWFRELGVDLARVLHAAEAFRYFAPVHAGDRLTFASRIGNVYQKKGGALTFLVKETDVTNQHGVRVAELRATIVVRGD
jgi:acyl dehydratase